MALWQVRRSRDAAAVVAERLSMWNAEQDQIAACGNDPERLQAYKAGLQERTKGNPYLTVVAGLSDALDGVGFALDRDAGLLDPDDPRYDPIVAARWDGGK